MATYTAIQGNPITVDLLTAANFTGWSQSAGIATHVSCMAGLITLPTAYPIVAGGVYQISYIVTSVGSGYVQARLGGVSGVARTTADVYVETLTAVANGVVQFYANGNCSITAFNISNVKVETGTTIAYSAKTKKWSDFRTYYPEFGVSLYTDFFTFKNGAMWKHSNGTSARCNFYGVQFGSRIRFSTNQQPTISKTFLSVDYQANQLLTAPSGGVVTAAGQLSELIAEDFIQADYGGGNVVYEVEGIYKASFMRDMNVDIVNGPQLKGNWMTIDLINASPSTPLNVFSTEISYCHSFANTR